MRASSPHMLAKACVEAELWDEEQTVRIDKSRARQMVARRQELLKPTPENDAVPDTWRTPPQGFSSIPLARVSAPTPAPAPLARGSMVPANAYLPMMPMMQVMPVFFTAAQPAPAPRAASPVVATTAIVAMMMGVLFGFGLAKADGVIAMLRPIPPVALSAAALDTTYAETTLTYSENAVNANEAVATARRGWMLRVPTPPPSPAIPAPSTSSNLDELEPSFRVTQ